MTPIKARPTLYKGIQMRSRLEADFAARLDHHPGGWPWEYEPTCFAADGIQWLPDFGIAHHGTHTYVELKPDYLLEHSDGESVTDRIDALLAQMEVTWQSEPDAILELTFWTYGAWPPPLMLTGYSWRPWVAETAGRPGPARPWTEVRKEMGGLPS